MNLIVKEDVENILKEDLPWEKLYGKTVLVSGASGFIPSYVVETLLAIGNVKVVALVRDEKKAFEKFIHHKNNKNLKIITKDVSIPFETDEKINHIIHAASQASPKYFGSDPVGTIKANTLGTYNLLELARKNNSEKFLFFSTGEVYGTVDETVKELKEDYFGKIDPTNVRSCYGESKRLGENLCVSYFHQYNISTLMIRLSHTYGPGVRLDDGRVFADFVKNIVNGENIILNSDGSAKRSFCYISDMIRAMFFVLFKGESANAYNIASDKETSILELAKTLISLVPEKNLELEFREGVFQKGYIKSESTGANFNVEKLKKLGWVEKTDIETGFKRMIKSYEV